MVVIKFATYTTKCPFTKKLIRPSNKVCLFNNVQFNAFNKYVNEILQVLLLPEIVHIIIEKTGYEKLIGRFGFSNYTHWTLQYSKSKSKSKFRKYLHSDNDIDNDSDNDIDNDSDNDSKN